MVGAPVRRLCRHLPAVRPPQRRKPVAGACSALKGQSQLASGVLPLRSLLSTSLPFGWLLFLRSGGSGTHGFASLSMGPPDLQPPQATRTRIPCLCHSLWLEWTPFAATPPHGLDSFKTLPKGGRRERELSLDPSGLNHRRGHDRWLAWSLQPSINMCQSWSACPLKAHRI